MRPEAVTDFELDAYLDGELDPGRSLAVEEHLAHNPDAAAGLMADLSRRSALRLSQAALAPQPDLIAAAERLNRRLGAGRRPIAEFLEQRKWVGGLAAAAVIALLIVIPTAPIARAAPPSYVADAIQAYHTGLLRAEMPSQIETTRFDAGDVARFTRLRVPKLPAGWQVTDAQLFPSDEGPALQLMVRTPAGQTVSIFAVRTAMRAPAQPKTVREDRTTVAYWRHGDIAYALTGVAAPAALDLAAEDLADNRLN